MPTSGKLHLLVGPVGAGKSTFGKTHALRHGGVFLDLDVWMVRLFGSDPRPADNVVEWYLDRRERCRGVLWDLACDVLGNGIDVILELGVITAADRQAFYEQASAHDVRLFVYLVDAPRDVRRERVMLRNKFPGPFTQVVPVEFFERASDMWQPPSELERAGHRFIDI